MMTPTVDEVRLLFDYVPETGKLIRKVRTSNRIKIGDEAGQKNTTGHLQCRMNGRLYLVHRLIWVLVYGCLPNCEIDHIDGDKTNNRLCNLRDVSHAVNMQNLNKAPSTSKTGLLGASIDKASGKFRGSIKINGKKVNLGLFKTASDAHEAYLHAKRVNQLGRVLAEDYLSAIGGFK